MLNHLFTIWLTDKNWDGMPLLNEICIASAQVHNNVPVTIYTNNKLHLSFLDRTITKIVEIPDELLDEAYEYCGYNKAHVSDYLRLKYLEKYGGIYFDTDILFWDSFDKLIDKMEYYGIMYLKEDKYMITNCCILCKDKDKSKPFFEDILWNYQNRFIRHSYLFNSQKYMNLMEQRHWNILKCLEEPYQLFKVKWNASNSTGMFNPDEPIGIGQHLFNSNEEWSKINEQITKQIYDKEPNNFYSKITKEVIDKYINLMMEEDKNAN